MLWGRCYFTTLRHAQHLQWLSYLASASCDQMGSPMTVTPYIIVLYRDFIRCRKGGSIVSCWPCNAPNQMWLLRWNYLCLVVERVDYGGFHFVLSLCTTTLLCPMNGMSWPSRPRNVPDSSARRNLFTPGTEPPSASKPLARLLLITSSATIMFGVASDPYAWIFVRLVYSYSALVSVPTHYLYWAF